jgi:hypothetical protein
LGEERGGISAGDISKVEDKGDPRVSDASGEFQVLSQTEDGGLAEDGLVVVLQGVGEAEL